MEVSVIIPVYNAELYIRKALVSALNQKEVCEIIVVDDGSTDNSITIVNELKKVNPMISIYFHEGHVNKGRASTRNLGIIKSTMPFIAFLDADDYFLEDRFENDSVLFYNNEEIEGVYNAIGSHYYRNPKEVGQEEGLMTIIKPVPSNNLFESLLSNKNGYFSIDGLTVKRKIFEKTGMFVEELKVAEDTDIFLKMALVCNLESGILDKPLAMRGVHCDNVFYRDDLYQMYRPKMYESLLSWSIGKSISLKRLDIQLKWLWYYRYKLKNNLFIDIYFWFKINIMYPKILFSILSIKYFPIVRLRRTLFPFLYK